MAARPAVAHYRLSRKEYQNTVYDLLGVRYDPAKPGELIEDTRWHGFGARRIGADAFAIACRSLLPRGELVLDRAFPAASGEARKVRKTAAELRYGGGKEHRRRWTGSASSALRYLLFRAPFRMRSHPTGWERRGRRQRALQSAHPASGIRPPGGQPAHLSIGKRTGEETVDGLIEFDLTAPEDSPQVYGSRFFSRCPRRWTSAWWPPMWWTEGAELLSAMRSAAGRVYFHA